VGLTDEGTRPAGLVVVTGGARSGKSSFAERLASSRGGLVTYVATGEARDDEMDERIRIHRDRRPPSWETVEEPLAAADAVLRSGRRSATVIVDCMALLASNLMEAAGSGAGTSASDEGVSRVLEEARAIVRAAAAVPASVVVVTNEVGSGVVPEGALARAYRDALGAANRLLVEEADEAYLMCAGVPVPLKDGAVRPGRAPFTTEAGRFERTERAGLPGGEASFVKVPPPSREAADRARRRLDSLTKPPGSLGVLEELSVRLAAMKGALCNPFESKCVIVMAGDHGVAREGVSAYPPEVTAQMLANIASGGAAVSVLARQAGARLVPVDIGVAADVEAEGVLIRKVRRGTDDISRGPAMSVEEARKAVETGIDVVLQQVASGSDLVATGEMGIGNTTPASALIAVFTGRRPAEVTGPGTGLGGGALARKVAVVERALAVNEPDASRPLEVLAALGGFEIAGLAGVVLGAASRRVPVIVDGLISTAAALCACALEPTAGHYLVASHLSSEPGHRVALEALGIPPLIHMDMRLGEGTGAVLAMNIVEAAARIPLEMATFESAAVSGPSGEGSE